MLLHAVAGKENLLHAVILTCCLFWCTHFALHLVPYTYLPHGCKTLFALGFKMCFRDPNTSGQRRHVPIHSFVQCASPAHQILLLSTSLPVKGPQAHLVHTHGSHVSAYAVTAGDFAVGRIQHIFFHRAKTFV